jgi:hypothetical protein
MNSNPHVIHSNPHVIHSNPQVVNVSMDQSTGRDRSVVSLDFSFCFPLVAVAPIFLFSLSELKNTADNA